MAKKTFAAIMILLFIASFAVPAYCDTPIKKLGRGFCNMATCPVELCIQTARTAKDDGPLAGLSYGLIKGIVMTVVRGVVGVYEVVTFPIPCPCDYQPILTDPEFVFDDMTCW